MVKIIKDLECGLYRIPVKCSFIILALLGVISTSNSQNSNLQLESNDTFVVEVEFLDFIDKGLVKSLKNKRKSSKYYLFEIKIKKALYMLDTIVYSDESQLREVQYMLINKEDKALTESGAKFFTAKSTFDKNCLVLVRELSEIPDGEIKRPEYGYFSGLLLTRKIEKWIWRRLNAQVD